MATDIIMFYQLTYIKFCDVHRNCLCYLGRIWYSQHNIMVMRNSKWYTTLIRQNNVPICSNPGPHTNFLLLKPVYNSLATNTWRLKSAFVGARKSSSPCPRAFHILVAHQNMVGWWLVLIYTTTPSTHYCLEYSAQAPTWKLALRATSHTRPESCDHYILTFVISRKCRDCPSSLHTRRWRPNGPQKILVDTSLHELLHGKPWVVFHCLLDFALAPPPRGGLNGIYDKTMYGGMTFGWEWRPLTST
jgi:hypothetical protein